MDWPNSDVVNLITLYQNHPVLWDSNLSRNKEQRQQALMDIAIAMCVPKEEVERKIRNLLSHYSRELRKERRTKNTKNCFRSRWFAYDNMSFLMNKITHRTILDSEAEISQDSIQVAPKTETDSSAKKRKKTTETATDKNKNGQISDHNEKYYQTPYRSQKLSKHYCIDNQKLNNNIRDCSTAFGEYIASKHRKYNDHVRSVIEHSISQILFDADMGNYNSPMRQTTGNDSPMVNHFENVTLNESKDETSDLYHVSKSSPYHTSTESDDNNDDSRINHANRLSTEDDTIISNVE